MTTPDITRAQVVAIAQAVIGVLVAFGAPISEEQSVALLALVAVLGGVLVHADGRIRKARNERAGYESLSRTDDTDGGAV
jgi:drug/metabolite transporter (DMT)-like permease